ncbi:MAG: hypothetical protein PWQ87_675 [Candidatus Woesearchaeota archaeon]|nr:hypothetical protein [Candidatus Woesearchaeota archaeon]
MAEDDKKRREEIKMTKIVSYDENNDILVIHKGFSSDEKFKGNIDMGELILDVSSAGRIRGIEVINATEFFKDFNVDKKNLQEIVDANFNASIKSNIILIGIFIKVKNVKQEISAKIAVPLEIATFY